MKYEAEGYVGHKIDHGWACSDGVETLAGHPSLTTIPGTKDADGVRVCADVRVVAQRRTTSKIIYKDRSTPASCGHQCWARKTKH